ncbi:hypothetical protein Daura_18665 [Dactylosporangium aurantiacum]|uniref:Tetratricopeptide repeat protein n=1 Tax=Dactylosporangium aurantiacum TaxID=35754 RepID=A0A9Q9IRD3_9ACTN|nr:hypothetical protein [Dactylosporangium aurantiacum]MDG6105806.1 hypothetical protein [Dactylosporangium aurantiacum]UWZ58009.1 hypothetical protein Daura_18665 [Dactylosporangium aurantiacum]
MLRRTSRRFEVSALRWSDAGEHHWAIAAAGDGVQLWRPAAAEHPSGLARALATRAMCLHVRGRTADAARDVEESLAHLERAPVSSDRPDVLADLAHVALMIDHCGRSDEALATVERLLPVAPRHAALLHARGTILFRHGRAEEAVAALREAAANGAERFGLRTSTSLLLLEALAATGRHQELREHAERVLPQLGVAAIGSVEGRRVHIGALELLQRHGVTPGRLRSLDREIAAQRRTLLRQLRRRRRLAAAMAVLTGQRRGWPPAPAHGSAPAVTPTGAAAAARVAQAEAALAGCRESGDARSVALAWSALAEARWAAGGQRPAALDAQREALAAARRWAGEHPEDARSALAEQLRRFATYAGTIGLRTDAQLALAEADELDGQAG